MRGAGSPGSRPAVEPDAESEWPDADGAPETRAGVAGTMLCREHVSLDPLFVTLLQVQEENFWPEDLLAGKHPLDPDYVTVNTLTRVPCRSSPVLPRPLLIRPRRPS